MHMIEGRHKSFKVLNLQISKVTIKIKVPRRKGEVVKDNRDGKVFLYDYSEKSWKLTTQRLIPSP